VDDTKKSHFQGVKMKALSTMGPLVLALAFGVIAMFVGGCNTKAGGKDAGDFCEDACDVLVVCGEVRCEATGADRDNCIFYNTNADAGVIGYSSLSPAIANTRGLESFCAKLCNEISAEAGAVSTEEVEVGSPEEAVLTNCQDALADVWECNAETTTCRQIQPLPLLDALDPGGVFLPSIGDCQAEQAVARVACEEDILP
jgi:hypothetical protein